MSKIKETMLEALIEHIVYIAGLEQHEAFREVYLDFAMRLADMRRAGRNRGNFNEAA